MKQETQEAIIAQVCESKNPCKPSLEKMRKAERVLNRDEQRKQVWMLMRIMSLYVNPPMEEYDEEMALCNCYSIDDLIAVLSATAEQRQEAFLRATDLWVGK